MTDPTDFGRVLGTGTWLREASIALRNWYRDRPDREAELGWLADGLDVGAGHLLDIATRTAQADPFTELIPGERARH